MDLAGLDATWTFLWPFAKQVVPYCISLKKMKYQTFLLQPLKIFDISVITDLDPGPQSFTDPDPQKCFFVPVRYLLLRGVLGLC